MLNFVYGRACSGKTQKMISRAASLSKEGQVVILVPEQFTFECERYIIKQTQANLQNIKVFSFTRLYNELLTVVGGGQTPPISDFENIIFINKAIKQSENNLLIFKRFSKSTDFAKEVAKTIKDFKFSGFTAEDIFAASEKIGGVCGGKLHDIASIYSVYEALIANKFIDPADYLTRLNEVLKTHKYFDGKTVLFDSFTGFTGQQYRIIKRILEQAKDVSFSFCTANPNSLELGLFYNINTAINRIKTYASDLKLEYTEETLENKFHNNLVLNKLESVFCDQKDSKTDENYDGINLISCKTPREEAVAAANIVRSLVEDKGYRYRDFIIVARDADTYQKQIEAQCLKNNISCFFDKSVPISSTPLYIFVKILFDIVGSFSTENILNYLKCGFNSFSQEDILALEEYVYIWDIKGSSWKDEWTMPTTGFEERPMNDNEKARLVSINTLRSSVVGELNSFIKYFNDSALKRSEALFRFIEKSGAKQKLSLLCENLEKDGDSYSASVLRQSWDSLNEILSSIVRVSDNSSLTDNEYIDMFTLASDSVNLSNTPQMLDEITFGSAERIRPSKPKVAIVLGANQNVFPKPFTSGGILGQADKQKLEAIDITLNDDIIKSTVEENYLVYSILCCPTEELYILNSKYDMAGQGLEPSSFISKIKENFKNITVKDFSLKSEGEFYPRTRTSAFSEIGSFEETDFNVIAESLRSAEPFSSSIEHLKAPNSFDDFKLSVKNAKTLFTDKLYLSASKFDTYHSCRFMYLLKYGLKVGKLEKADLNALQRGTVAHYVFEKMIARFGKKLSELDEAQISKETDILIDEYFKTITGANIVFTPKFLFMLSNISKSVKNVLMHMANEFKQSDFEPAFCELEISSEGQVPELRVTSNEGEIILSGKIDRVDTFKNAVRVVDYKTGKKSFELSDILYGLNMQMLIYLYAVIKNGGEVLPNAEPAGILYMPARSRSGDEKLVMNGLISDDPDIYTAMEKDNGGVFIPKLKKGTTSYISKDAFPLIFNHIENLMCKMQEDILKGEFLPNPTDTVKKNACTYCDFASICRKSDMEHIKPVQRSADEVLEILKGEDSDEI